MYLLNGSAVLEATAGRRLSVGATCNWAAAPWWCEFAVLVVVGLLLAAVIVALMTLDRWEQRRRAQKGPEDRNP